MNSRIQRLFLPGFLRARLRDRPGLLKILDNIGWLFVDKMFRMAVGLLVGVWVARYLGPEQFGLLNFALAFAALFGAIGTLGLQGIIVRDLVSEPNESDIVLGSGLVLRIIGGIAAFGLMVGIISLLRPDDTMVKAIVAILGFTHILKASEVVKYWFESQVQSKYVVWAENAVVLVVAGVKVAMLLLQAPLIAFVWAALAEAILAAACLLAVYRWKVGNPSAWKGNLARAKSLLGESWPYIIAGMTVLVYLKADQLMLGQMVNDRAVGIYSVAVKLTELWYLIPLSISISLFPAIIASKKNDERVYLGRMQSLYDFLVALAVIFAALMTGVSTPVVRFVFGPEYEEAGGILAVYIWMGVFYSLSYASSKWYLNERLHVMAMLRNAAGALINVALNVILIPRYGPMGAATGTLISLAFASYFFDYLSRKTRPVFFQKTKSLLFLNYMRMILRHTLPFGKT